MRSSRYALLLFGAGAVLGLVLVSAGLPGLAIAASALMAAALLFLPFALIGDWWAHRPWRKEAKPGTRKRTKSSPPRKRGSKGK